MSGTEQELSTITKVKKRKGEPAQDYFARLAEGARTIPDADWEGLSTDAQAWVNAATKAQDDHKPIAEFESDATDEDEAEEDSAHAEAEDNEETEMATATTSNDTETTTKSKKTKKAAVKAKTTKKNAGKTTKTKGPKAPRTVSARRFLKEMIIKNPKLPIEELSEKLSKAGHKLSELSLLSIIRDTQNTLQIANELGLYKRDM